MSTMLPRKCDLHAFLRTRKLFSWWIVFCVPVKFPCKHCFIECSTFYNLILSIGQPSQHKVMCRPAVDWCVKLYVLYIHNSILCQANKYEMQKTRKLEREFISMLLSYCFNKGLVTCFLTKLA